MNQFARDLGILQGDPGYEKIVATRFANLWRSYLSSGSALPTHSPITCQLGAGLPGLPLPTIFDPVHLPDPDFALVFCNSMSGWPSH